MTALKKYNDLSEGLDELSKVVERILPVHSAQIYSYLKASQLPLGFLVNFNVPLIKEGIKRFVPKQTS